MRYAIVTETYPPEINGVALTVQGLEQGLRDRGHEVQIVRPRPRPRTIALRCARNAGARRAAAALSRPALRTARDRPPARLLAGGRDRTRSTSPPKARWAGRRCARRAGWAFRPRPASTPASTNTCATTAPAFLAAAGAALDAPLPQQRRRDAGAHARAGRTSCDAQRLRQRRAAAARGGHARCSIHGNATPACARNGASARQTWWRSTSAASPRRRTWIWRCARSAQLQAVRPDARFVWVGDGPARAKLQRDQSGLHLLRRATRRNRWRAISPAATCSCFPSLQRDLRQRHARGHGQRRADGGLRLRRRARAPARRRPRRGDRTEATKRPSSTPCVRIAADDDRARAMRDAARQAVGAPAPRTGARRLRRAAAATGRRAPQHRHDRHGHGEREAHEAVIPCRRD